MENIYIYKHISKNPAKSVQRPAHTLEMVVHSSFKSRSYHAQ
jgi:hypothetical protein